MGWVIRVSATGTCGVPPVSQLSSVIVPTESTGLQQEQEQLQQEQPAVSTFWSTHGTVVIAVLVAFTFGFFAERLFTCVRRWWDQRFVRLSTALEKRVGAMLQVDQPDYGGCVIVLERGIAKLQGSKAHALAAQHLLARVFLKQNKSVAAEKLLQSICQEYESSHGKDLLFAEAKEDYGKALCEQKGREGDARAAFQEALTIYEAYDAVVQDDDISGDLSRVIDRLTYEDGAAASPISPRSPVARFSPSSPWLEEEPSRLDSQKVAQVKALIADLKSRGPSPTTVVVDNRQ